MVNKKELRHLIESYHIKFYIVFGIILFLLKDIVFFLMCQISHITSKEDFFYEPYRFLTYSALAIIWGLIFYYNTRKRAYHSKTGRDFRYDSKNYHRSYNELVDYFKDADPLHMNIESLPIMNWRDSSGLIFGKIGDRLISFEPRRDGICAMIWGSPGDGKTTSTIITSCRQFRGSVMVTDLKGDIYEANKNYRRIKRFSTMHWKESAHYDPLAVARNMSPGEREVFLSNLALTIIPEEDAQAKYFVDTARDYFTGICLFLLNDDDTISFPDIIEQIVLGNFKDWVIRIKQSQDIYAQSYTNQFFQGNEKNLSGGYSKLVGCTRLFSSDIMKKLLTNDEYTISPDDLENGTDIYIQIDPNQISLMAPVISMLYQSFMSVMLYRKEGQEPPIAFIMDEFGQIPAMPVIEQSAALMRAYNCSLMFACQSLAMLDGKYGIAGRKKLMDCVKVNCFLSIMDPDTRDWASRLIGSRKVLKISNSEQLSRDGSTSRSVTEARENIFEPAEFGNLPNDNEIVIYMKGKYIKAEKTYYYK